MPPARMATSSISLRMLGASAHDLHNILGRTDLCAFLLPANCAPYCFHARIPVVTANITRIGENPACHPEERKFSADWADVAVVPA